MNFKSWIYINFQTWIKEYIRRCGRRVGSDTLLLACVTGDQIVATLTGTVAHSVVVGKTGLVTKWTLAWRKVRGA